MVNNIFLALGSNKGDRLQYIKRAVKKISENLSCRVLKYSSVYETTPYGTADQPNYLNAVIEIESDLKSDELLSFIKDLEKEIGRTPTDEKWGQREIDVDIIFYNDVIYSGDKMIIPHPECLYRDFVMVPLVEIAPDFIHPGIGKKLSEIDILSLKKHILSQNDFPINI